MKRKMRASRETTRRLLVGLLMGATVGLVGCSSTPLNPGASRVVVSTENAPKGCKFRGMVVGEQGGAWSGAWTSNKNLQQGALNDLRNKADTLGANYVVLQTNRADTTSSGSMNGWSSGNRFIVGGSSSTQVTDSMTSGAAYRCPNELIGLD